MRKHQEMSSWTGDTYVVYRRPHYPSRPPHGWWRPSKTFRRYDDALEYVRRKMQERPDEPWKIVMRHTTWYDDLVFSTLDMSEHLTPKWAQARGAGHPAHWVKDRPKDPEEGKGTPTTEEA